MRDGIAGKPSALPSHQGPERLPFLIGAALLYLVAVLGLIRTPLEPMWLWAVLLGVSLGTIFPLALALPIDLQHPARAAATVSLVLTVGYTAIVPGLLLMGVLRDALGSFTLAWTTTLVCGIALLVLCLARPATGRGLAGVARR